MCSWSSSLVVRCLSEFGILLLTIHPCEKISISFHKPWIMIWILHRIEVKIFSGIWRREKNNKVTLFYNNLHLLNQRRSPLSCVYFSLWYQLLYLWVNAIKIKGRTMSSYMEILVLVPVSHNSFEIKDKSITLSVDCFIDQLIYLCKV